MTRSRWRRYWGRDSLFGRLGERTGGREAGEMGVAREGGAAGGIDEEEAAEGVVVAVGVAGAPVEWERVFLPAAALEDIAGVDPRGEEEAGRAEGPGGKREEKGCEHMERGEERRREERRYERRR